METWIIIGGLSITLLLVIYVAFYRSLSKSKPNIDENVITVQEEIPPEEPKYIPPKYIDIVVNLLNTHPEEWIPLGLNSKEYLGIKDNIIFDEIYFTEKTITRMLFHTRKNILIIASGKHMRIVYPFRPYMGDKDSQIIKDAANDWFAKHIERI